MPTKVFPVIKLPQIWSICCQNQKGKFYWMKAKEMWGAFSCNKNEAFWNVTGHNRPAIMARTREKCSVSWSDSQRQASARSFRSMCRNVKNVQKMNGNSLTIKRKSHSRVWIYLYLCGISQSPPKSSLSTSVLSRQVFKCRNLVVSYAKIPSVSSGFWWVFSLLQ